MLRSAYSAFLGAFITGAAFDTVRDRVLDTFYPVGSSATAITVIIISLAIPVLFLAIHACNDWSPELEEPIAITGTPAPALNSVDLVAREHWRPRSMPMRGGALG